MKANEMRMRIEDMLQEGHLTIVIDEAHYLFPLVARPKSSPERIDWLRTALLDHGVAIALIATPQFDRQCAHFEKCIKWNAKQIKGRVKLQTLLPSELPVEDLEAVARMMAPSADDISINRLVGFAEGSDDYLAGIERLTCRADFFAMRDGRTVANAADIKRALNEALPVAVSHPAPTPKAPKAAPSARAIPLAGRANRFRKSEPSNRLASMDSPASEDAGFEAGGRLQFTGGLPLE